MKTVYVSPKTQSISVLPQTMQMQTTSPFANPEETGPVMGPLS